MKLIRGLYNLASADTPCVASIGGFDGIHLGHQTILQKLISKAHAYNLPATAITFEPLPREYFAGHARSPRLMSWREKIRRFAALGIDQTLCIPFNAQTAAQEASVFLKEVLLDRLQIRYLVVGDDFSFGHNRTGNSDFLQAASLAYGFEFDRLPPLHLHENRISSTRIRELLRQGDLRTSRSLLGTEYSLYGKVTRGDQRGRTLGFPTANIHLKNLQPPVRGVFAVQVTSTDLHINHQAVANIGVRPTFAGTRLQLEVHLFDFNGDLYGQRLCVSFLHKIRDEQKFDSIETLKTAIQQDYQHAQQYFHAPS